MNYEQHKIRIIDKTEENTKVLVRCIFQTKYRNNANYCIGTDRPEQTVHTLIRRRRLIRPRGYKPFFMLNSAEHEKFSANKYESWHFYQSSAIFSKKEFRTVSNLRFIQRANLMLS